jgi:hypothetical protein
VTPVAATASASPIRVAGIQSPPDMRAGHLGDPCRAKDPQTGLSPFLSNTMTGSLIGCWYTDTFNQLKSEPSGEILALGTENFVGCLDADRNGRCAPGGPHETFAFIYAFEGKFYKAGKEIRGQCQHPIVSGTGDFKGAGGRLNFKDHVATGTSAYRGKISLAKRSGPARATALAAHGSLPAC